MAILDEGIVQISKRLFADEKAFRDALINSVKHDDAKKVIFNAGAGNEECQKYIFKAWAKGASYWFWGSLGVLLLAPSGIYYIVRHIVPSLEKVAGS